MNKEKEDKTPSILKKIPLAIWAMLGTILLFLVAWFVSKLKPKTERKPTFTKKNLRKLYGVDAKTFNKWIFHFCESETFHYQEYLSKRKLSEEDYQYIIECLGEPSEKTPVWNKSQIADPYGEATDNIYRTLRKNIIKQKTIPIEIYDDLRMFPPKIVQILTSEF